MAIRSHLPHTAGHLRLPPFALGLAAALLALAIIAVVAIESWPTGAAETQRERDAAFFDSQQDSLIGADGGGAHAELGRK